MISNGKRLTSAAATEVLPDAVGPMRKTAGGNGSFID
jgi:hypothetical protein